MPALPMSFLRTYFLLHMSIKVEYSDSCGDTTYLIVYLLINELTNKITIFHFNKFRKVIFCILEAPLHELYLFIPMLGDSHRAPGFIPQTHWDKVIASLRIIYYFRHVARKDAQKSDKHQSCSKTGKKLQWLNDMPIYTKSKSIEHYATQLRQPNRILRGA